MKSGVVANNGIATIDRRMMRFASAISENEKTSDALAAVIAGAREAMDDRIDIAFLFLTGHHASQSDWIAEQLWLQLDPQAVIGCSGEGVLGGDVEVERRAGMALLVAQMPHVRIHPFHIAGRTDWEDVIGDEETLRERMGIGPQTRAVIGMGDPFTSPATQLLAALDAASPGVPLIGGFASAGQQAGENVLIHNDRVYDEGFVGLSLSGPLSVETIVSQGCRPIGRSMVITKSNGNVIEQLGGRPAIEALRRTLSEISSRDEALLREGLFIGQAISEYRESFGQGDFLVRNVLGLKEEVGGIVVGDYVKTGRTAQFQVRDAESADEELTSLLKARRTDVEPAGGLLFNCNGRGTHLFKTPSHDIKAARGAMPTTPFAGFFAAGEIGPLGGRNFLHGHTASFALFRPLNRGGD